MAIFFSTEQAAELVGMSPATLATLRVRGGGPRFHRLGSRTIRYTSDDLLEWAKPAHSTAEKKAEPHAAAA